MVSALRNMDPFANGFHCVYDHTQHAFVPFDPHEQPSLDVSHPSAEVATSAQEHIRRPRNAFLIFRAEFQAANKINRRVEHDNRNISRIVGHYWNGMTEEEKSVWQLKADQEKMAHMRKYPHYKFSPSPRGKKPVKHKARRNGDDELARCRRVADLLLEGKEGEELANAVKDTDFIATRTSKKGEEDDGKLLASHIPREDHRFPKGPYDAFRNPLSQPENVDGKSPGTSSANFRIVPSATINNYSPGQPSFPSSHMSPMPYEVMRQPDFNISPLPQAMSHGYYPEKSGLLPDSITAYNSYLQSSGHPYTEPMMNFHSPAEEHCISFDFLNSIQPSIQFDSQYRAPSEFTLRHKPRSSRSMRDPGFHPYNYRPSQLSARSPLQSPDFDTQFLDHDLRH